MTKATKAEQAAIYLRPMFKTENFSFEDAKEYLATKTDFGRFTKQSWDCLIRKGILISNQNGVVCFSNENNEDELINSAWIDDHRKHFVCKENNAMSGFGDFFTESELSIINEEYFNWKETGKKYLRYGFRRPNLPEFISEGLPSALFGWVRTNGLPLVGIENSADLVDPINGDAIQIKGISTYGKSGGGPTSFGPNTKFNRLIIMHVRLDKDKAYFYEMDVQEYKNWKVNDQMSLREQQEQGRRPRLTLLPLIEEEGLTPFVIYDFKTGKF